MSLFAKLGFLGNVLALMFFISLFFAGITSAVSMVEPFVFYLINKFNLSRLKAIVYIGIVVYLLGTACAFCSVRGIGDEYLTFFGMNFFDILDFLSSNIIMPFGAFMAAIFVGFVLKKEDVKKAFLPYMNEKFFNLWYIFARFVATSAVIIIAVYQFVQ